MTRAYLLGQFKLENSTLVLEDVMICGSDQITQDLKKIICTLREGPDDTYLKSREWLIDYVRHMSKLVPAWKIISNKLPEDLR